MCFHVSPNTLIFTYPNADANNAVIVEQLQRFAARHDAAHLFVNLGRKKYHSLQRYVAAMVGNSSSGIIEAASFRLPVVNIGDRQKGRLRTPNIVDAVRRGRCNGERDPSRTLLGI